MILVSKKRKSTLYEHEDRNVVLRSNDLQTLPDKTKMSLLSGEIISFMLIFIICGARAKICIGCVMLVGR